MSGTPCTPNGTKPSHPTPHIDRTNCPGRPGAHHPRRVGTPSAYNKFGCRCLDARDAWRIYRKRGREGRRTPAMRDSTGTARRLQALAAIGWALSDLQNELGVKTRSEITALRSGHRKQVTTRTHLRVKRLYEQLFETPGPDRRAALWARKNNWAPPIAWDDDGSIDDPSAAPQHNARDTGLSSVNEKWIELPRLLEGNLPELRGRERKRLYLKAVEVLTERGMTALEIAERLRTTERTVTRFRAKLAANSAEAAA